jgi:hypothetical protein
MAYQYPVTLTSPIPPPPQAFSNQGPNPTIFGVLDGVNPAFYTGVVIQRARVYRNGQLQTLNVDCCFYGTTVVFIGSQIPQPGDQILIEGWI